MAEATSKHVEKEDYGASFVETAVRIAQTIDGSEERGEILSSSVNIYAEAGRTDLALELAQTIDDSYQRDLALTKIAALAASGDGEQAESLLDLIEDDAAYALAIEQIAAVYARSGKIDKAISIAQRLSDSASALSSIALACPSGDLLEDCIEIARSIDYPELKATTLIELAIKARTQDQHSAFAELIEEAVVTANKIDIPHQRIEARLAIAALYKEEGQIEQAAAILHQTRRDCKEMARISRDVAIEQVAVAYAEMHEFESADQLLEAIDDPFHFSHASASVAFEYYAAGDLAAAIKLLGDGLEVVKDEPVYGPETSVRREAVVDKLARTYAAVGRIEDALAVVELLDAQEQRDITLRQITAMSAASDNPHVTFTLLEKIKDDFAHVLCKIEVVRTWTPADQVELADHLLAQVPDEIAKIERPYQRTICLAELAQAYDLREQTSRAAETLFAALQTAVLIEGSYHQARALLALAVKHNELTRPASEPELQTLDQITNRLD